MDLPPDLTPEPYEWLTWLQPRDAAVLLQALMQGIEYDAKDLNQLRAMVRRWRTNAHQAITDEDWEAWVDPVLRVKADARRWVFQTPAREDRAFEVAIEAEREEDAHAANDP